MARSCVSNVALSNFNPVPQRNAKLHGMMDSSIQKVVFLQLRYVADNLRGTGEASKAECRPTGETF